MIVTKDLRVDVLGEALFEKVNLVIRSGERIAVVSSKASDGTTLLRVLAGETEMDAGTVRTDGERVVYVSSGEIQEGREAFMRSMQTRPSFLLIDAGAARVPDEVKRFVGNFHGGILISSNDASLMETARTTKVLEIRASRKTVTSYTGSYATYMVEKEKNDAKEVAAYEKQQKEKRRLEDWLTNKRIEATNDRSPEKGATIRTKAKYLQREILDKEIPKPPESTSELQ